VTRRHQPRIDARLEIADRRLDAGFHRFARQMITAEHRVYT
jgi:hypothetical protein